MIQSQSDAPARRIWLIRGLLATILALLATSKAFLPQYLLWVCPLAALLAHDHQPRISRIGWYLFGVNLISVVVFFFFYPDLIEMHLLPGITPADSQPIRGLAGDLSSAARYTGCRSAGAAFANRSACQKISHLPAHGVIIRLGDNRSFSTGME